jgi:uncharacterized protein YkwD
MTRPLRGPAVALAALAVAAGGPAPARADDLAPVGTCPGADLPTSSPGEQVNGMLCMINYARTQHGLPSVSTSDLLTRSAGLKAQDEISCNDFTHTPCGRPVNDPFERAGYIQDGYEWKVGENLAKATAPLGAPRQVMDSWLKSPEHRDNILSGDWKEQGIALLMPDSYLGATGSAIWVSHFGERHAVSPPPTPASASGSRKTATKKSKRRAKRPRCRTSRSGGRAAGVGVSPRRKCRARARRT